MPEDASSCVDLDCCPPSFNIPPILTSEPLLVELANIPPSTPYPSPFDSLTIIQTELFTTILT